MRHRSSWSPTTSTRAVERPLRDPLPDRPQAVVGSATGCRSTRVTAMGQRAHDDRHSSIHIVNFDQDGLIPTPCDRPTTVSGNVLPERPIRDTHGDDTWPWARRLQQEPYGRDAALNYVGLGRPTLLSLGRPLGAGPVRAQLCQQFGLGHQGDDSVAAAAPCTALPERRSWPLWQPIPGGHVSGAAVLAGVS
jgi:hypothetical protein